MTEKETYLHKKLDKEINLFKYQYTLKSFTEGYHFNEKGRFILGIFLLIVFVITYSKERVYIEGAFLSILLLILPPAISLTTKLVMTKFKPKQDNLYDALLGIGSFGIAIALCTLVIYLILKYIYRAVTIPQVVLQVISYAGPLYIAINYILMKRKERRGKK